MQHKASVFPPACCNRKKSVEFMIAIYSSALFCNYFTTKMIDCWLLVFAWMATYNIMYAVIFIHPSFLPFVFSLFFFPSSILPSFPHSLSLFLHHHLFILNSVHPSIFPSLLFLFILSIHLSIYPVINLSSFLSFVPSFFTFILSIHHLHIHLSTFHYIYPAFLPSFFLPFF